MLSNWKHIDEYAISLLKEAYNANNNFIFHHSVVQCINDKMLYKIIDNILFIAKKSAIMGNYSMILYNTPIGYTGDYSEFLNAGIGIRNNIIKGTKDSFGVEYVYDCDSFIKMEGSKYRKHRNAIRRHNITLTKGNDNDIAEIVEKWSEQKKQKHQLKLYRTILKNLDKVTVTKTIVDNQITGFSIVENLNNSYGVILQRLINPDIKNITEPNIILHYNDCIQHHGMILNMGGCVGIKNMEFAKKKLIPMKTIQINRIKPNIKLTKEQYNSI